eukprot:5599878-Amphidinium_carterae.1
MTRFQPKSVDMLRNLPNIEFKYMTKLMCREGNAQGHAWGAAAPPPTMATNLPPYNNENVHPEVGLPLFGRSRKAAATMCDRAQLYAHIRIGDDLHG